MEKQVGQWVNEQHGLTGDLRRLSGYDDINFVLTTKPGVSFVIKLSKGEDSLDQILAQCKILDHVKHHSHDHEKFPEIVPNQLGEAISKVRNGNETYALRVLTYLSGTPMATAPLSLTFFEHLGSFLGDLNQCLVSLDIPALHLKKSGWDLQYAHVSLEYLQYIVDPHYRRLTHYFIQQFQLEVLPKYQDLPKGIIHGDANDHNILIVDGKISGMIDFGDATHSYLINELAIAITYVMLIADDPIEAAILVCLGYHQERNLSEIEIEVLYYLVGARLASSLCFSSHGQVQEPNNHYITLHQQPVKQMMDRLISINPLIFENKIKRACGYQVDDPTNNSQLLTNRNHHISGALSLSYSDPIAMNKGAFQYLYDHQGNTYLDAVNNISHVGHCHPQVVSAAHQQSARLNTNTRYLYQSLNDYAEALSNLLPDPLSTVFLVNSGTEANELALRLARVHVGQRGMVVLSGAYHGNSAATIEVSPYKYRGSGGEGKQPFIHELPVPDLYRGPYREDDADAVDSYLTQQLSIIEQANHAPGGIAGFIGESLLGCGGQILLPPGYLEGTYKQIRNFGGICIADEVQVGFGRIGSHFWGFQAHGVVPDIVTMGKPMGNGHPMGAVVTTKEIASSFDNGMEYFNSFGGNPVSCEIGKTVLSIIESEGLQENAKVVGKHLKLGLEDLKNSHPMIGDVRGLGLFLGIEIVENQYSREPNAVMARQIKEAMKDRGILLSTDGPMNNVIKIKPPLVFTKNNADRMIDQLDQVIKKLAAK